MAALLKCLFATDGLDSKSVSIGAPSVAKNWAGPALPWRLCALAVLLLHFGHADLDEQRRNRGDQCLCGCGRSRETGGPFRRAERHRRSTAGRSSKTRMGFNRNMVDTWAFRSSRGSRSREEAVSEREAAHS